VAFDRVSSREDVLLWFVLLAFDIQAANAPRRIVFSAFGSWSTERTQIFTV